MKTREPAYYENGGRTNLLSDLNKARNILQVVIEGSYDGIYITDGDANTLMAVSYTHLIEITHKRKFA